MKNIIVAYDANRGIGSKGHLPWSREEMRVEMKLFRQVTMGGIVIMGRKTMESIGAPLIGRRNIVITRDLDFIAEGFEVAHSLDEAFEMTGSDNREVFVIGGAEIYKQAIDKVDRIYASELIDELEDIDTYFPEVDASLWTESHRTHYKSSDTNGKYDFYTVVYDRIKKDFVELSHARNDEQRKIMEDIIEDGVCPFCTENLAKYHKKEILMDGVHWLLTYNQWPYDNTELHLLAIAKDHVVYLNDMKTGAAEELFEFLKWAERHFYLNHGAVCMRFGEIKKTGATINHLHAHLIVSKVDLSKEDKVRFTIS